jgi:hypothetical protein
VAGDRGRLGRRVRPGEDVGEQRKEVAAHGCGICAPVDAKFDQHEAAALFVGRHHLRRVGGQVCVLPESKRADDRPAAMIGRGRYGGHGAPERHPALVMFTAKLCVSGARAGTSSALRVNAKPRR